MCFATFADILETLEVIVAEDLKVTCQQQEN
jgi:hypothetical protein